MSKSTKGENEKTDKETLSKEELVNPQRQKD